MTEAPAAPRHWEADVLLRDGRTAHIRPIRAEDADLLVEFYSRVSDESKYYRFFSPMPTLSARDVSRFTQVDHDRRVALVMLLGGRMIAVGRYDADPESHEPEAEVAFLVEDEHQGRGIAQLLLEHLAQAGRERGIERFSAEVLPDNQRMIQTFRDAGYHVVSGYEDGVLMLEFPIDPTDTAVGVMRGPRAPSRGRVDRAVLQPALGRDHRRQPAPGHDRPGARAQPGDGRLHRPGLRGEPDGGRGVRHAGVPRRSPRSPTTSTSRSWPCRPKRSTTSCSTARPRACTG